MIDDVVDVSDIAETWIRARIQGRDKAARLTRARLRCFVVV